MPKPDDPLARLLRRAAAAPPRELDPPAPAREAAVLRAWRAARAEEATRPRGLLALLSLDGLLAPALGSATALLAAVLVWTSSLPKDAGPSTAAVRSDSLAAEIEEMVTEPSALLAYEN